MANDLTAWNNARFQVSFDVSAWSVAYPLAAVTWRMQARTTAENPVVVLEFPGSGTIAYDSGVVVFSAPVSAVSSLNGHYEWDFGFIPPGGEFVRVDGGALTIVRGVTR